MLDNREMQQEYLLFIPEMEDAAIVGMSGASKIQNHPDATAEIMDMAEGIKNCFSFIRRSTYMIADVMGYTPNLGYYNIENFMKDISEGISGYFGNIFGIEIGYTCTAEDCINMVIDLKLMERAIFDAIISLVCRGETRCKKITLSVKVFPEVVKFLVKSDSPIAKTDNEDESNKRLLCGKAELFRGDICVLAAKRIGGSAHILERKNGAQYEICIPTDLKAEFSDGIMRENEEEICLGEPVMKFKVSSYEKIENYFSCLAYELNKK